MVVQHQMITPRVNGAMLAKYQNENVCIMGTVQDVLQSPKPTIKIRTTDGQVQLLFLN